MAGGEAGIELWWLVVQSRGASSNDQSKLYMAGPDGDHMLHRGALPCNFASALHGDDNVGGGGDYGDDDDDDDCAIDDHAHAEAQAAHGRINSWFCTWVFVWAAEGNPLWRFFIPALNHQSNNADLTF